MCDVFFCACCRHLPHAACKNSRTLLYVCCSYCPKSGLARNERYQCSSILSPFGSLFFRRGGWCGAPFSFSSSSSEDGAGCGCRENCVGCRRVSLKTEYEKQQTGRVCRRLFFFVSSIQAYRSDGMDDPPLTKTSCNRCADLERISGLVLSQRICQRADTLIICRLSHSSERAGNIERRELKR